MKKNNRYFASLLGILLLMTISSCQPTPITPENPHPNTATDSSDVQNIQVDKVAPQKSLGSTEEFPLPNCGGTITLTQNLGTQVSVSKSVQMGTTLSANGGAEVGVSAVAKLKVEAAIEATYQQEYNSANSRLDTIGMGAAPKTHVIYLIEWEKQEFSSMVTYDLNRELVKTPYTFTMYVPKIASSREEICPNNTKSPTNTPISTNTPTPTDTPIATSTPSNTGLLIGQTFSQGNISLTVTKISFSQAGGMYSGGYIKLNAVAKNISNNTISFNYGDTTFFVRDNLGNEYRDAFAAARGRIFESSVTLNPGRSAALDGYLCCGLAFGVNYTDSNITEITFIVTNLSGIEYAEWVIPIYH